MLESLANISLFEGLEAGQLEILQPLFETYSCAGNTVIFEQGEDAVFLYLIVKGLAIIQYKPYDSPPITLTRLKEGDVFGWSAAIGNPSYSSSILSIGDVQALRIRGTDLVRLCRQHPDIGAIILNRLAMGVSGRWKDAHVQVESMLSDSIQSSAGTDPGGG